MANSYILYSPLRVQVSKQKYFTLNINSYRNQHYHVLNKSKVEYKNYMYDQVIQLPHLELINLTYTLYPPSKRRMDISNVLSVVDKYFSDCLVELGKLDDDDYKHICQVIYQFGSIDKESPRVEIRIGVIK